MYTACTSDSPENKTRISTPVFLVTSEYKAEDPPPESHSDSPAWVKTRCERACQGFRAS